MLVVRVHHPVPSLMHKKRQGTLGELKVATYLVELGYSVFKEIGDISRIDLILEKEKKLYRIQVKAFHKRKGNFYYIDLRKSGPNYKFSYGHGDVDIFAMYCIDEGKIAWIRADDLFKKYKSLTIRTDVPKGKNGKSFHLLSEFEDLNACF